ncbi:MAG: helix-turn-helix transcriptional regulator [Alphaproteobacteria bacterium]|nr:helix-turn-helix transcriptional regulator [Alphaproteobacteria bacterium]
MKSLARQLRAHISRSNLTVRDIERLAGLKRCALSNILEGKSKNPSLDTLQASAKVLGCSVSDLLESTEAPDTTHFQAGLEEAQKPLVLPVRTPMLCEIMSALDTCFKNISYEPNLEQFWQCAIRVYSYTLGSTDPIVDPKFVQWLVNKFKE